ncbi:unnamed protein product [Ectocarpus sp. 12 AP-2014]
MEPERLRGGLNSDMGVGGADLDGEPILLGAAGELSCQPSSPSPSCMGEGGEEGEVGAGAVVGAAVPVLSSPSRASERAGDVAVLSSSGAASPTAPPGGGMDDMFGSRARKADAQYTLPLSWFSALARLGM